MLRDFEYSPSSGQLRDVLSRFGIKPAKASFALLKFEVLTPDSFMWRVFAGGCLYYLYAEDYIPDLDHVKKVFDGYLEGGKWDFVEPVETIKFETASPVTATTVYKEPEGAGEMMKYAVDSGFDFVFLAKSHEDAGFAQFSDHAPGGFVQK